MIQPNRYWRVEALVPNNIGFELSQYDYNFGIQISDESEFVKLTFLYDAGRSLTYSQALYTVTMLLDAVTGKSNWKDLSLEDSPSEERIWRNKLAEIQAICYNASRSSEDEAILKAFLAIQDLVQQKQN